MVSQKRGKVPLEKLKGCVDMCILKCKLFNRDTLVECIIEIPMGDDSPKTYCEAVRMITKKSEVMNCFVDSIAIIYRG